jgi:oxygen-independent coproporphyrinogen-3 oxidase
MAIGKDASPVFRHIYVHVPFCVQKCAYCDFYSVAGGQPRSQFINGLERELTLRTETFGPIRGVETLYIGGGTPSCLDPQELLALGRVLHQFVVLAPDYEWTVEANPESLTPEKIDLMREIGANRLSLGVQSLDDGVLASLGRSHTASDARRALETVYSAELDSWSVDLMFGVAGQTLRTLQRTVSEMLSWQPPHVSAYALMIEPGSLYAQDSDPSKFSADETATIEQFEWLMDTMETAGYRHYEVSNYAEPGRESRHNRAYWRRRPYLGLGPSAHSFDGATRWWNVRAVDEYAALALAGKVPTKGSETLTEVEVIEEIVMLSLRTNEGLAWNALPGIPSERIKKAIPPLAAAGFLSQDGAGFRLTRSGFAISDAIIRRVVETVCS